MSIHARSSLYKSMDIRTGNFILDNHICAEILIFHKLYVVLGHEIDQQDLKFNYLRFIIV